MLTPCYPIWLGRTKVHCCCQGELLAWKTVGLALIIGYHSAPSHAGNTTLLNDATQMSVNPEGENTMQPGVKAKGNQYVV